MTYAQIHHSADGFEPARRALSDPKSTPEVRRAAIDLLAESDWWLDIHRVREERAKLFAQTGAELRSDGYGLKFNPVIMDYDDFSVDDGITSLIQRAEDVLIRIASHVAAFVAGVSICAWLGGLL